MVAGGASVEECGEICEIRGGFDGGDEKISSDPRLLLEEGRFGAGAERSGSISEEAVCRSDADAAGKLATILIDIADGLIRRCGKLGDVWRRGEWGRE